MAVGFLHAYPPRLACNAISEWLNNECVSGIICLIQHTLKLGIYVTHLSCKFQAVSLAEVCDNQK